MSELNGTVSRIESIPTVAIKRPRKAKAPATAGKPRVNRKALAVALSARRKVALAVGGVGTAVLLLSVWHCTEALTLLTGAPLALAALLAVGIDCGLVACEVAVVASAGVARGRARLYVGLAVALSAILNAVASAEHAQSGFALLAYGVGALVPVLVLLLGQVASHLWTE